MNQLDRPMVARRASYALLPILIVGVTEPANAQDLEQQIRSEVRRIVEKINSADAAGLADMYLQEPSVGSLGDGQITKGWDDVADLLSMVFAGGQIRMAVDSLTLTPLGDDAAIAYFRYSWDYNVEGASTTIGAMTVVFVRGRDGWKVAHDHTSTLRPTGAGQVPYSGPPNPVRSTSQCTVSRIVDGDTIECAEVGRVRLIGMDTPESDQEPYGSQATKVLLDLIAASSEIRLERDVEPRDQYGRVLAYVWCDGQMLNWILVRAGYAVVLTYPPNVSMWNGSRRRRRRRNRREPGCGPSMVSPVCPSTAGGGGVSEAATRLVRDSTSGSDLPLDGQRLQVQ